MFAGLAAYGLWGVFPLVFNLLDDVSPVEILFHRVIWSFVVVVALLALQRRFAELTAVRCAAPTVRLLGAAAVLISVNWLTYIWAVNNGHVVDAALGYYVNPLITVALGVVVLKEQLRGAQRVALGFGAAAVVVLTVASGSVPWIALVLACSFAGYGYLKKAADVAALPPWRWRRPCCSRSRWSGSRPSASAARRRSRTAPSAATRCCSVSAW